MRVLVVVLVLVVAAAAWFLTMQSDAEPPVVPPTAGGPAKSVEAPTRASALPEGTVATRVNVVREPATGLADAPSACLVVVDHETQKPVAEAVVRRVQSGDEIGFTDERGFAALPLREQEQLAIVRDGYLLRLAPTRVGTTEAEPQRIELVRDRWSPRLRFTFRAPDGGAVADAFVRFRSLAADVRSAPRVAVPANDAVVQRAWTEHGMLAGRPVCADVPVELGAYAPDRVHRLGNGQEVRFVVPGEYDVEVATVAGFTGRVRVRAAAESTSAADVVVQLTAGGIVAGTVVGADGPLEDAAIAVEGGDPLGLVATTRADGTFRLGPLLPGTVVLHVRHRDHEALATQPLQPPVTGLRVQLQPLPRTTLRGRVRVQPDLRPLAGANVVWMPAGGAPITATTDADGTFVLPATGTLPSRLAITAPMHLAYAELVTPGAPFADYDILPASTDVRLQKKMTALLEGVILDASGRPLPRTSVRWMPAQRTAPAGPLGRRVLEGAVLDLPLVATTGDDGAFRLETNAFGVGRLVLVGGDAANAPGIDVEAAAGVTRNGLRLQR